ncbi:hypothetical protein NDU88_001301 [Pleurodeles waltl]|uniref:Uncharacterized protein n=1 Tax=Pleurodeles waltl TaxID=8319 RepID=A0AAV7SZ35_PLEWA|nr:hypothetical protein NDU88_001301 [Pleurodeles waltl]
MNKQVTRSSFDLDTKRLHASPMTEAMDASYTPAKAHSNFYHSLSGHARSKILYMQLFALPISDFDPPGPAGWSLFYEAYATTTKNPGFTCCAAVLNWLGNDAACFFHCFGPKASGTAQSF